MKFVGLTFVVALAWFSASSAAEVKAGEDGIYILTPENYKQAIRENKRLLMIFLSSSCKDCAELYPQLVRAAAVLKGIKSKARIGRVDFVKGGPIAQEFGVTSAGNLRICANGEVSVYYGERDFENIVEQLTTGSD